MSCRQTIRVVILSEAKNLAVRTSGTATTKARFFVGLMASSE